MLELDVEIREGLERLTGSPGHSSDISLAQLTARRRRRRIRRAAVATMPLLLAGGLISAGRLIAADTDTSDLSADVGPAETRAAAGRVAVVRTEVRAEGDATTRVVLEFDRPLPGDEVTYVRSPTGVSSPTIAIYTTQGPEDAQVCGDTHDFGPSAVGTVDLLLPSAWFSPVDGAHTSPLDKVGGPPKFVVCGPHLGFYQYSIWGPASANPLDVEVTIDDDRLRLTIEIDPMSTAPAQNGPRRSAEETTERSQACGDLIRSVDAS